MQPTTEFWQEFLASDVDAVKVWLDNTDYVVPNNSTGDSVATVLGYLASGAVLGIAAGAGIYAINRDNDTTGDGEHCPDDDTAIHPPMIDAAPYPARTPDPAGHGGDSPSEPSPSASQQEVLPEMVLETKEDLLAARRGYLQLARETITAWFTGRETPAAAAEVDGDPPKPAEAVAQEAAASPALAAAERVLEEVAAVAVVAVTKEVEIEVEEGFTELLDSRQPKEALDRMTRSRWF